jgi:hypothetical protein
MEIRRIGNSHKRKRKKSAWSIRHLPNEIKILRIKALAKKKKKSRFPIQNNNDKLPQLPKRHSKKLFFPSGVNSKDGSHPQTPLQAIGQLIVCISFARIARMVGFAALIDINNLDPIILDIATAVVLVKLRTSTGTVRGGRRISISITTRAPTSNTRATSGRARR